jgi:dihydropyrimidinase
MLHVTKVNQLGMDNIRRAQGKGLPVYGETCPQYLNLTWDDLVIILEAPSGRESH